MKPCRHVPILQSSNLGIDFAMVPSLEVVGFTKSNENLNGEFSSSGFISLEAA